MNEQDILRIGEEAKRIMDTEAFRTVVQLLQNDLTARFFGSNPEEKRMREDLYLSNQALEALINTFANFADSAAAIRARDEESTNE